MGRALRGAALLAGGQALGQIIGFVVLAIASRTLGPAYLGGYFFSTQFVVYLSLVTTLGLPVLAIRDVAREAHDAGTVVSETVLLRVAISLPAYLALVGVAPLVAPDETAETLLPIVGLKLLCDAVNLDWALQGQERSGRVALSRVAGQVAYGIVAPLVLVAGLEGARRFAFANILGYLVAAMAAAALLLPGLRLRRPNPRRLLARLRSSIPFGWSLAMIQVYYSIDFLMLGYFQDAAAVGQYGVAYRIPQGVIAMIGAWSAALYPFAAKRSRDDLTALRQDLDPALRYSLVVALPTAFLCVPVGSALMTELFGADFAPAGTPFVILMITAAIILVSVNFVTVVLACGDEQRYAITVTIGAAVNIAVNLVTIPQFGATGAAASTLLAECVVLALLIMRARTILGGVSTNLAVLAKAAVATLTAIAVCALVSSMLTAVAGLVAASMAFALVAVATRAVTVHELRQFGRRRATLDQ